MGGTTTQSSQTQTIDPELRSAYLGNLNNATQIANSPALNTDYQSWVASQGGVDQVARQRTPEATWAFDKSKNLLNTLADNTFVTDPNTGETNIGAPGTQQAYQGARDAMATPYNEVGGVGYDANPYKVGQSQALGFGSADIQKYANPYTDQVVNRGMADLERQRQIALQNTGASAIANHAYGGSRQGVAEGETNRGFADAMANFDAQQRSAGYGQGQQMAQFAYGDQSQRDLANQGLMANAGQFNASQAQNADLANQQANFQNIAQRLQASGLLQGIGSDQWNQPQQLAGALQGTDAYQRGVSQEKINAALSAYDWSRQAATQPLQLTSAALGIGIPNLGGTVTGTTKTTQSPLNMIQSLVGLGGQLGSAALLR